MSKLAVYLSGSGSLDGSDVMTSVLTLEILQELGHEPVAVGRDVSQGEVLNHRTARSEDDSRNALDEAARIVRGDILDMRDLETDDFEAALFVGGGGVLSTWTDYHERGAECRVTERLKFHVLDFYRDDRAILALDNAGFALGSIFRHVENPPVLNPGDNDRLVRTLENWDLDVTNRSPCWDRDRRVGCLPDLTRENHFPDLRRSLRDFFVLAGIA